MSSILEKICENLNWSLLYHKLQISICLEAMKSTAKFSFVLLRSYAVLSKFSKYMKEFCFPRFVTEAVSGPNNQKISLSNLEQQVETREITLLMKTRR